MSWAVDALGGSSVCFGLRWREKETAPGIRPPSRPGVTTPLATPAAPAAALAAAVTPAPPSVGASPESAKPGFDIVRVSPSGDAVLAGRAAPGAEVVVADNGREIGRTQARGPGQLVLVP